MATKRENEAVEDNAYKALEDALAIDFQDGGKSGQGEDEARPSKEELARSLSPEPAPKSPQFRPANDQTGSRAGTFGVLPAAPEGGSPMRVAAIISVVWVVLMLAAAHLLYAPGVLGLNPSEGPMLIRKINEPCNQDRRRILALRANAALGEVILDGHIEATVEHILPLADDPYWIGKFPRKTRNDLKDLLGNFTIVTAEQNRRVVRDPHRVSEGIRLRDNPAQRAFAAFEFQIVFQQIRPEREDDREADQIDVEREKDDAERQRALGTGTGVGFGVRHRGTSRKRVRVARPRRKVGREVGRALVAFGAASGG